MLRLALTEFYTSIQADNTMTFILLTIPLQAVIFLQTATTAVTITFPTPHGMSEDDIVLLDNVTAPPGSGYTDADFEDKKFMATSHSFRNHYYGYHGLCCIRNHELT